MQSLFFIIAFCCIIGHIQNDLISPTFPQIINSYNTTPRLLHFASGSYVVGVSIGGIGWGAISDYIGRKKILLTGLFVLTFGCFCTIFASNIYYLIFFRFINGIGTAAPVIICVAIIFDYYEKSRAKAVVGFINAILTFSKSIAPIMGGYLSLLINWKLNFLFITINTLFAMYLVIKFIQETSPRVNALPEINLVKNLHTIMNNYIILLSNKIMLSYLLILGFMSCSMITYTLSASIIYINYLGVSNDVFGYHQGIVWAFFGIFCLLTHYILKSFSINSTKIIGFALTTSGCVLLNYTAYVLIHPFLITLGMTLCSSGFAILTTILFSEAMLLYPHIKGASSSMITFIRTFLTTINILIAGYFFNGTIIPFTIIITTLVCFKLILYLLFLYRTNDHN